MKKEISNKEKWKLSFIKTLKYSFWLFIILFVLNLIGDLFPFYNPRLMGSLLISVVISTVLFLPILINQRVLHAQNSKLYKLIFLFSPFFLYLERILIGAFYYFYGIMPLPTSAPKNIMNIFAINHPIIVGMLAFTLLISLIQFLIRKRNLSKK